MSICKSLKSLCRTFCVLPRALYPTSRRNLLNAIWYTWFFNEHPREMKFCLEHDSTFAIRVNNLKFILSLFYHICWTNTVYLKLSNYYIYLCYKLFLFICKYYVCIHTQNIFCANWFSFQSLSGRNRLQTANCTVLLVFKHFVYILQLACNKA